MTLTLDLTSLLTLPCLTNLSKKKFYNCPICEDHLKTRQGLCSHLAQHSECRMAYQMLKKKGGDTTLWVNLNTTVFGIDRVAGLPRNSVGIVTTELVDNTASIPAHTLAATEGTEGEHIESETTRNHKEWVPVSHNALRLLTIISLICPPKCGWRQCNASQYWHYYTQRTSLSARYETIQPQSASSPQRCPPHCRLSLWHISSRLSSSVCRTEEKWQEGYWTFRRSGWVWVCEVAGQTCD